MSVNPIALEGYEKIGSSYDNGRPGYPVEAIEFLIKEFDVKNKKLFLDVGAGTGKFTQYFVNLGPKVVALEPVDAMIASLKKNLPSVEVIKGNAEKIPLDAASVDILTCAQSFHWFDFEKSLPEIERVLKPNGIFILIWNTMDTTKQWVEAVSNVTKKYTGTAPNKNNTNWENKLKTSQTLSRICENTYLNNQSGNFQTIIDRTLSTSYISKLSQENKSEISNAVRNILESRDELDKENLTIPYITHLYCYINR